IVIVGLGVTGFSCVSYFLAQNVVPRVIDTRAKPQGIEQLDERIEYHLGGFNREWLINADLIVLSPGIALATPVIQEALQVGVEVVGDIELFCREVNQYRSEEHTSELQSRFDLVCRLLL